MTEFKFKITHASGYSYEYSVRANEKLDAFAKIKAYINERYASPDLIDYKLIWD